MCEHSAIEDTVCRLEVEHLRSMGVLPEDCDTIMENVTILHQSLAAQSPAQPVAFPDPLTSPASTALMSMSRNAHRGFGGSSISPAGRSPSGITPPVEQYSPGLHYPAVPSSPPYDYNRLPSPDSSYNYPSPWSQHPSYHQMRYMRPPQPVGSRGGEIWPRMPGSVEMQGDIPPGAFGPRMPPPSAMMGPYRGYPVPQDPQRVANDIVNMATQRYCHPRPQAYPNPVSQPSHPGMRRYRLGIPSVGSSSQLTPSTTVSQSLMINRSPGYHANQYCSGDSSCASSISPNVSMTSPSSAYSNNNSSIYNSACGGPIEGLYSVASASPMSTGMVSPSMCRMQSLTPSSHHSVQQAEFTPHIPSISEENNILSPTSADCMGANLEHSVSISQGFPMHLQSPLTRDTFKNLSGTNVSPSFPSNQAPLNKSAVVNIPNNSHSLGNSPQVHGRGTDPLQSLHKLAMFTNSQVVDPKSVVHDACFSGGILEGGDGVSKFEDNLVVTAEPKNCTSGSSVTNMAGLSLMGNNQTHVQQSKLLTSSSDTPQCQYSKEKTIGTVGFDTDFPDCNVNSQPDLIPGDFNLEYEIPLLELEEAGSDNEPFAEYTTNFSIANNSQTVCKINTGVQNSTDKYEVKLNSKEQNITEEKKEPCEIESENPLISELLGQFNSQEKSNMKSPSGSPLKRELRLSKKGESKKKKVQNHLTENTSNKDENLIDGKLLSASSYTYNSSNFSKEDEKPFSSKEKTGIKNCIKLCDVASAKSVNTDIDTVEKFPTINNNIVNFKKEVDKEINDVFAEGYHEVNTQIKPDVVDEPNLVKDSPVKNSLLVSEEMNDKQNKSALEMRRRRRVRNFVTPKAVVVKPEGSEGGQSKGDSSSITDAARNLSKNCSANLSHNHVQGAPSSLKNSDNISGANQGENLNCLKFTDCSNLVNISDDSDVNCVFNNCDNEKPAENLPVLICDFENSDIKRSDHFEENDGNQVPQIDNCLCNRDTSNNNIEKLESTTGKYNIFHNGDVQTKTETEKLDITSEPNHKEYTTEMIENDLKQYIAQEVVQNNSLESEIMPTEDNGTVENVITNEITESEIIKSHITDTGIYHAGNIQDTEGVQDLREIICLETPILARNITVVDSSEVLTAVSITVGLPDLNGNTLTTNHYACTKLKCKTSYIPSNLPCCESTEYIQAKPVIENGNNEVEVTCNKDFLNCFEEKIEKQISGLKKLGIKMKAVGNFDCCNNNELLMGERYLNNQPELPVVRKQENTCRRTKRKTIKNNLPIRYLEYNSENDNDHVRAVAEKSPQKNSRIKLALKAFVNKFASDGNSDSDIDELLGMSSFPRIPRSNFHKRHPMMIFSKVRKSCLQKELSKLSRLEVNSINDKMSMLHEAKRKENNNDILFTNKECGNKNEKSTLPFDIKELFLDIGTRILPKNIIAMPVVGDASTKEELKSDPSQSSAKSNSTSLLKENAMASTVTNDDPANGQNLTSTSPVKNGRVHTAEKSTTEGIKDRNSSIKSESSVKAQDSDNEKDQPSSSASKVVENKKKPETITFSEDVDEDMSFTILVNDSNSGMGSEPEEVSRASEQSIGCGEIKPESLEINMDNIKTKAKQVEIPLEIVSIIKTDELGSQSMLNDSSCIKIENEEDISVKEEAGEESSSKSSAAKAKKKPRKRKRKSEAWEEGSDDEESFKMLNLGRTFDLFKSGKIKKPKLDIPKGKGSSKKGKQVKGGKKQSEKEIKKTLGPVVKVKGAKEKPVTFTVMNISDPDLDLKSRSGRDIERNTIGPQQIYDLDESVPFVCAICGHSSSYEDLGDLYGPYYPKHIKPPSTKSKHNNSKTPQTESASSSKATRALDSPPKNLPQRNKKKSLDSSEWVCASTKKGTKSPAVNASGGKKSNVGDLGKKSRNVTPSSKSAKKKGKSSEDSVIDLTGPDEKASGKGTSKGKQKKLESPAKKVTSKKTTEASKNMQVTPKGKKNEAKSTKKDGKSLEISSEIWVHGDCLIWTTGVYIAGYQIFGIEEAVAVSKTSPCSVCKKVGATLGCFNKGCGQKYHYLCSTEAKCFLDEENFSVFCPKHKGKRLKALGEKS